MAPSFRVSWWLTGQSSMCVMGRGTFFDNLGDKVIYDDFELNFKVLFVK
jgi:hypothetical protein